MAEYTPTTHEVRTHWTDVGFAGDNASFDRWLEAVKAAAWDEGQKRGFNHRSPMDFLNPYRKTGEQSNG